MSVMRTMSLATAMRVSSKVDDVDEVAASVAGSALLAFASIRERACGNLAELVSGLGGAWAVLGAEKQWGLRAEGVRAGALETGKGLVLRSLWRVGSRVRF